MCEKCNNKFGSTKHLLYWQAEWFRRFITTWWHIVNRKAYWKWYHKKYTLPHIYDIDEGLRMDLDEIL